MIGHWVTLAERKAKACEAIASAAQSLRSDLRTYARAHGGKFILFGSVARGDHRYDSDVDILVDFPTEQDFSAWLYAETCCRRLGLAPDIQPLSWCDATFVQTIMQDSEILQ